MFAPQIATTKANATAESTNGLRRRPSTRVTDGLGIERAPVLHRTAGNQAMLPRAVQAKLIVGPVDDPLEHEADRIADQLMRMPAPLRAPSGTLQRKWGKSENAEQDGTLQAKQSRAVECEPAAVSAPANLIGRKWAGCKEQEQETELKVQAKLAAASSPVGEAPPTVHEVLSSPGQPLDHETRGFFEARFERDFANVRIHEDEQAARSVREVGALAYTFGCHVVVDPAVGRRESTEGRHLLAHELTHVIQQSRGPVDGGVDNTAGTRLVQRQAVPPTRGEMIAALDADVLDGKSWKEVAVRLNGFNPDDVHRMIARMKLEQILHTRQAVTEHLAHWPRQTEILAALDSAARSRRQPAGSRPPSSTVWAAYEQVAYDVLSKDQVWELVGGFVGKTQEGQDSCATRISWSLNHSGFPIVGRVDFINFPNVTFKGKPGDGMSYDVNTGTLSRFLLSAFGKPDAEIRSSSSTADAEALEASLGPGQIAIIVSAHHAGVIKVGYREDPVWHNASLGPFHAWKLP